MYSYLQIAIAISYNLPPNYIGSGIVIFYPYFNYLINNSSYCLFGYYKSSKSSTSVSINLSYIYFLYSNVYVYMKSYISIILKGLVR